MKTEICALVTGESSGQKRRSDCEIHIKHTSVCGLSGPISWN